MWTLEKATTDPERLRQWDPHLGLVILDSSALVKIQDYKNGTSNFPASNRLTAQLCKERPSQVGHIWGPSQMQPANSDSIFGDIPEFLSLMTRYPEV